MVQLVEENKIAVPLFDPASVQAANNAVCVQDMLLSCSDKLSSVT